MAIRFKDFFPEVLSKGFFSTEFESLKETVARANEWLVQKEARVLNVETVVLPNIGSEGNSNKIETTTWGEMSSHWYQVVRIWYLTENEPINQS